MIQRIQTLWLLFASAGAFLSLKLPFYAGTTKEGVASHQLNGTENYLLMFTTILIGLLALVIIFLFKNRTLQLRLCILGIILTIGLIALYYVESTTYLAGTGTYALTALLPALVIFFFFFALKGISRDIKVIRDSNRLR